MWLCQNENPFCCRFAGARIDSTAPDGVPESGWELCVIQWHRGSGSCVAGVGAGPLAEGHGDGVCAQGSCCCVPELVLQSCTKCSPLS